MHKGSYDCQTKPKDAEVKAIRKEFMSKIRPLAAWLRRSKRDREDWSILDKRFEICAKMKQYLPLVLY